MQTTRIRRALLLASLIASAALSAPCVADAPCVGAEASTPSVVIDGAQFGAGVAIAGNDVFVGAPGSMGAVFVYRRGPSGAYVVQQQLTRPSALLSTSGFGSDIAVDGTIVAVGAPFHNSSQGAVVLYSRASNGNWSAMQTLFSPIDLPYGNFGFSVAMSGGYLAVGAPAALNVSGFARGVVWLYARQPDGLYTQVSRFDPLVPTASQDKFFGWSVGLQNSTLVVAAPGELLSGDSGRVGAAYVFRRSLIGGWSQVARLKSTASGGWAFGTDLAVGSEGINGAGASIFVREQRAAQPDAIWQYTTANSIPAMVSATLAGETPAFGGAPSSDIVLANSMAIHEGFGLVGSPNISRVDQYIFNGLTWSYDRNYVLGAGGVDNGFGQGVAVGHDQIAIGAPQYEYGLNDAPGLISIQTHDLADCNADGQSDACFIAANGGVVAVDRNTDGVPDACQLVSAPPTMAATQGEVTTGVFLAWGEMDNAARYQISLAASGGETVLGYSYVAQYLDTTAPVGVLRTYRVRTQNAAGTLSDGFVAASGWRRVAAPTNVVASNGVSLSAVAVTWTGSPGATGYKVVRTRGTQVTELATVTGTSYSDTTATAGLEYLYAVRAVAPLGDSVLSAPDAGFRAANAAAIGVAATDGTLSSGVQVVWTAPEGGTTTYKVLRQEGSKAPKVIGTVGATVRTFTDTTGKAGKTYRYIVRLSTATSGGANDFGWRARVGASGAAATDGTSTTGVIVTWNLAPGASKATGYAIYRGVGSAEPILIGSVGKKIKTFTDLTPVPGVLYTYSVRAYAGGLTPPTSNEGWRALSPPAALGASDGTYSTKVRLEWPNATGATSYIISRTGGSSGPVQFTSIANSYDDISATPTTVYTYTVKSVCALGISTASVSNTGYRATSTTVLAGPMPIDARRIGAGPQDSQHPHAGWGAGAPDLAGGDDSDLEWASLCAALYHLQDLRIEQGLFVMGSADQMVADLRDPLDLEHAAMLVVTGDAVLNGGLRVRFQGYEPVLGDRWTLILASRVVGDFRLLRAEGLPEGTRLQVHAAGSVAELEVVAIEGATP